LGAVWPLPEGIETALAVIEATGLPAWATGNAYLLETFMPPPGVEQVLVFADKDRPFQAASVRPRTGSGADVGDPAMGNGDFERARSRLPSIFPDGRKGVDWLDVFDLLGEAGFPALGSVRTGAEPGSVKGR
jgi:putative DNA primase/helicase